MRDCSVEQNAFVRTGTLCLFVLLGIIGRGIFAWFPFDSDGSMYIYMGRLAAEGERVGRDLIDIKFATVGLLLSLPWRAIGAHWIGWIVLGLAISGATSLILSRMASRHFGTHAARPTLLASLALLNLNPIVFGGFQLETVYVFFVTLAAAATLRTLASGDWRDAFVVGLCAGVGAYAKPTAMGILLPFALATMLARRERPMPSIKIALACAAGLAVPLGGFAIYVYGTHSLNELLMTAEQIGRYSRGSAWLATDLFKPVAVAVLAGFPLLVRGWVMRRDRVDTGSAPMSMWIFLVVWLLMEFVGAVVQRRMYAYHFFPMVAPLAILFGALPRRDRSLPTAAALVPIVALSLFGVVGKWSQVDQPDQRGEVVAFLNREAAPGDRIWQDDCARLLIETDLKPGSRYPLTFLFSIDDEAPSSFGTELVNDLRERRPRFVVLDRDVAAGAASRAYRAAEFNVFAKRGRDYQAAWAAIESFTRANYVPVASIGDQVVWEYISPTSPAVESITHTDTAE